MRSTTALVRHKPGGRFHDGATSSGRNQPAQERAGRELRGYGQKRTFCSAWSTPEEDKERTISEQEPIPGQGSSGQGGPAGPGGSNGTPTEPQTAGASAAQGGTAWGAGRSQPPPPPGASPWSSSPYPPAPTTVQRVRSALQARAGTEYIFNFWSALGWTVLTLGFYGYYVFYQLMRRMRDHNARRVELLDATLRDSVGRRRAVAGYRTSSRPPFSEQRGIWPR